MPLTPSQIAIVKSTAPIIKQHGTAITSTFYRNMLAAHPELKNIFSLRNQQSGAQQTALANAVYAYAAYIDDLPKLKHAVERIAHKHTSLFVKPEQYTIVGTHLVGAFAEVLGGALTPQIADAWTAAYGQLADVFIGREKQLYEEKGAWQSWRKFKIARKESETDHVASLYLEPNDGKPLPSFQAGQYVSVRLPLKELDGLTQCRQFSLSLAPEDNMTHYRISVKDEPVPGGQTVQDLADGKTPGVVSNRLFDEYKVGDEVDLSPPAGEFFFDPATPPQQPVVLISVGVGATPLVSILDTILASSPSRPVTWAHGARTPANICFGKHVDAARQQAQGNLRRMTFVDDVPEANGDYDVHGKLTVEGLAADNALHLDNDATGYFVCGPEEWMVKIRNELEGKGVSRERIHLELFRTGDVE